MDNTWFDIPGYEGLYMLSKNSDVKMLSKSWIAGRGIVRHLPEGIMKQVIKRNGYYHVTLSKDKKKKQFALHTLMALTFIPNPENKRCVNHKDGNKLNNKIENLERATYLENNVHALKERLRVNPSGKENGYSVPVKVIKGEKLLGEFDSLKDAAKHIGFSYDKLYDILRGRTLNTDYKILRNYVTNGKGRT